MIRSLSPLFLFACLLAPPAPAAADDDVKAGGHAAFDPANAVYRNVHDMPVKLIDGLWEGTPYVEGGAARPRIGLLRDFLVLGDLDGDGEDEAAVALWRSSGGSGTFQYLAVLDRSPDGGANSVTVLVGDRVRIDGGRIEDGQLLLDVVQHGPDEPACCPTQSVTRHYDASLNLVSTRKRTTP